MKSWQVFALAALSLAGGIVLSVTNTAPELAAALVGAAIGAIGGRAGAAPKSRVGS